MISHRAVLAIHSTSLIIFASAFAPPHVLFSNRRIVVEYIPPLFAAGPPIISNWRYQSKGTITGTVTNHPTIEDGEQITTSVVKNPASTINENITVETKSGSKYKLSNVAYGATIPATEAKKGKEVEEKAAVVSTKSFAAVAATSMARVVVSKPVTASKQPAELRKLAKSTFSLTGASIGPNGKYLISGNPRQSSGRAAKIWTAYVADPNNPDVPAGFENGDASGVQKLTMKLSPDVYRLQLENSNYNKVQSGLFKGRFVKKIEYMENVQSNKSVMDGKFAALVMESGQYDLKALLASRKGLPLRGRALRDAASAAGQCIQAVHSSNLVWTDLKTENFIVVNNNNFDKVGDIDGKLGLPGVRGIDLESVIAKGGNPIDYTPEACPPEFAKAYMGGYAGEFILNYSYDMW